MGLTDDQLLAIYGATIDPLYGYVSRRCGGERELAEDITQETWLRAVREWVAKGAPERPLAWLQTVAHNLLASHFRRSRPLPLDWVGPEPALEALDSGAVMDSAEAAMLVNQALARLPSRHSRVLEAFHFDERRVAEIAAELGTTERAVEGRLRRARQGLRKELERAFTRNGGTR
ncbi:MAG: RNA polymerase sigma factor [Gemmatimonadales bacterium]